MFDYLQPKDGPVVNGLESQEVVYAKDQPQYIPLRTLVNQNVTDKGYGRVISRWVLNDYQREAIAKGADIFLELLTFGERLQPIRISIGEGEPDPEWVKENLLGQKAEKAPKERGESPAA